MEFPYFGFSKILYLKLPGTGNYFSARSRFKRDTKTAIRFMPVRNVTVSTFSATLCYILSSYDL